MKKMSKVDYLGLCVILIIFLIVFLEYLGL